jgi:hypothetical protein
MFSTQKDFKIFFQLIILAFTISPAKRKAERFQTLVQIPVLMTSTE